ncbi:MAG: SDR family oxidoreductase [Planctomycetaceae bacterium]
MPDFLGLNGKTILVLGAANRKSVAWHVGQVLTEAGATVLHSVRSEQRRASLRKLAGPEAPIFVCDVERQEEIERLRDDVADYLHATTKRDEVTTPGTSPPPPPLSPSPPPALHGIVHSIAFADYSAGWLPFHETPRQAFLQAVDVSCFSLIAVANAFKDLLDPEDGSVVTISISTTRMAAENYGYMAPVKAALDSSVCFLAKSFSTFGKVRFNAVGPGLLKSSASAGIPGYVDSYLFAEKATLRKEAVKTEEVADTTAFLLSPRSSGINAQHLVIDAGMGVNYFDRDIVRGDKSQELGDRHV